MFANRPLIVLIALAGALALLPLAPGKRPAENDVASPQGRTLQSLLPLGRERFLAPLPPAPDSFLPENAWLAINNRGLDIIKKSEGLRLNSYYLAGQWLIGYGHAATAEAGKSITRREATLLLLEDVRTSEAAVRRLVRVRLNENEFSALTALAYNIGESAFARSVVLKRLNAGDRAGAADAFLPIVTAKIRGERVTLSSLKSRRKAERALFLTRPLRS